MLGRFSLKDLANPPIVQVIQARGVSMSSLTWRDVVVKLLADLWWGGRGLEIQSFLGDFLVGAP